MSANARAAALINSARRLWALVMTAAYFVGRQAYALASRSHGRDCWSNTSAAGAGRRLRDLEYLVIRQRSSTRPNPRRAHSEPAARPMI